MAFPKPIAFDVGAKLFTDRDYTIAAIDGALPSPGPAVLQILPMNDKTETRGDYVTLRPEADALVHLCWNENKEADGDLPTWVSSGGWVRTGTRLAINWPWSGSAADSGFLVYARHQPIRAGETLSLGGAEYRGVRNDDNYVILVQASSLGPLQPPSFTCSVKGQIMAFPKPIAFDVGAKLFTDRDYTIAAIDGALPSPGPAVLQILPMNDKTETRGDYVTLRPEADALVHLCWNENKEADGDLPTWVSSGGWVRTGTRLAINWPWSGSAADSGFLVYARHQPIRAGETLSLGGAEYRGVRNDDNYVILVQASGLGPLPQAAEEEAAARKAAEAAAAARKAAEEAAAAKKAAEEEEARRKKAARDDDEMSLDDVELDRDEELVEAMDYDEQHHGVGSFRRSKQAITELKPSWREYKHVQKYFVSRLSRPPPSSVRELKAELDKRNVDHSKCREKKELAELLVRSSTEYWYEAREVIIDNIQRLKNPPIMMLYAAHLKTLQHREKKRKADKREALSKKELELKWVFHACAAGSVDNIIGSGFNRSYAGKNATVYGKGTYFARDASYSARDTYSPPDDHGRKKIFLCRLAIGAHTPVRHGYGNMPGENEPPVRDNERVLGVGALRYDTTTGGKPDRDGKPEILVAYKDNQAYPDYLVTFRFGGSTSAI